MPEHSYIVEDPFAFGCVFRDRQKLRRMSVIHAHGVGVGTGCFILWHHIVKTLLSIHICHRLVSLRAGNLCPTPEWEACPWGRKGREQSGVICAHPTAMEQRRYGQGAGDRGEQQDLVVKDQCQMLLMLQCCQHLAVCYGIQLDLWYCCGILAQLLLCSLHTILQSCGNQIQNLLKLMSDHRWEPLSCLKVTLTARSLLQDSGTYCLTCSDPGLGWLCKY